MLAWLQGAILWLLPALRPGDLGISQEWVIQGDVLDDLVGLVGDHEAVDQVPVLREDRGAVHIVGIVPADTLAQLELLLRQVDARDCNVLTRLDRNVHWVDVLDTLRGEHLDGGGTRQRLVKDELTILVGGDHAGITTRVGRGHDDAFDWVAGAVVNNTFDVASRCLDADKAKLDRLVLSDSDLLRPALRLWPAIWDVELNGVLTWLKAIRGEVAVLANLHRWKCLDRLAVLVKAWAAVLILCGALDANRAALDWVVAVIKEPAADRAWCCTWLRVRRRLTLKIDPQVAVRLASLNNDTLVTRRIEALRCLHLDDVLARLETGSREDTRIVRGDLRRSATEAEDVHLRASNLLDWLALAHAEHVALQGTRGRGVLNWDPLQFDVLGIVVQARLDDNGDVRTLEVALRLRDLQLVVTGWDAVATERTVSVNSHRVASSVANKNQAGLRQRSIRRLVVDTTDEATGFGLHLALLQRDGRDDTLLTGVDLDRDVVHRFVANRLGHLETVGACWDGGVVKCAVFGDLDVDGVALAGGRLERDTNVRNRFTGLVLNVALDGALRRLRLEGDVKSRFLGRLHRGGQTANRLELLRLHNVNRIIAHRDLGEGERAVFGRFRFDWLLACSLQLDLDLANRLAVLVTDSACNVADLGGELNHAQVSFLAWVDRQWRNAYALVVVRGLDLNIVRTCWQLWHGNVAFVVEFQINWIAGLRYQSDLGAVDNLVVREFDLALHAAWLALQ